MTKPAESEEFSHASPKRGARATVRTLQRDAAGRVVAARAKTGGAAKSRRDAKSPRPVADSTVRGLARLQRLAAEQGVEPATRFEDLLGDFWPEDESMEEFLETLSSWRQDRADTSAP